MRHIYRLVLSILAAITLLTGCGGGSRDSCEYGFDDDCNDYDDCDESLRDFGTVVMTPLLKVVRAKDGPASLEKEGKTTLRNVQRFGRDCSWADSLGSYKSGGRWGYYHAWHGTGVIPPKYIIAYPFSEGKAAVLNEAGWLEFIDREGKVVISFPYAYRGNIRRRIAFSDGRCVVAGRDGKYGVVDGSGGWIIPPEYDDIQAGREYAVLCRDGVNRQVAYDGTVLNELVVNNVEHLIFYPGDDDYSSGEETGFYEYTVGERAGLMDEDGKRLTEPLYEDIEAIGARLFKAQLPGNDELYVLLNGKGEVI